jgi:dTDP-4-dehydrorhamnose reductase
MSSSIETEHAAHRVCKRRSFSVRILLTGRGGQVGWELERALAPLGEVIAFDRAGLDLADPDRVRSALRELQPGVVVNAAAYTAVDRAESEPEAAFAINARAPGILAEEAARLGALLIHYSTDYVFDGAKAGAYTEDDIPNPLNVYGASKLEGERAISASGARHWIFRTGWVYAPRGKNFFLTILRLAREGKPLRVVSDQFGAPTSAAMLARATAEALSAWLRQDAVPPSDIYHMSAAGRTSWHGFACAILREFGVADPVTAITTAEYSTPAKRPANSLLDNGRLAARFGIRMPSWEAGLREAAAAVKASS